MRPQYEEDAPCVHCREYGTRYDPRDNLSKKLLCKGMLKIICKFFFPSKYFFDLKHLINSYSLLIKICHEQKIEIQSNQKYLLDLVSS